MEKFILFFPVIIGVILDVIGGFLYFKRKKLGIHVIGTVTEIAKSQTKYAGVKVTTEAPIVKYDIAGLLRNKDDPNTLIPFVNVSEVPFMKRQGIISGGMIPKIDCCVEAVRRGVKKTSIIDGRVPHSILIEILSKAGIGTQFK